LNVFRGGSVGQNEKTPQLFRIAGFLVDKTSGWKPSGKTPLSKSDCIFFPEVFIVKLLSLFLFKDGKTFLAGYFTVAAIKLFASWGSAKMAAGGCYKGEFMNDSLFH